MLAQLLCEAIPAHFPLYYGFLALWFVVLPWLYTWPEGFQTASSPLWSWAYLTNVLQALQRDLGAAPTYTGHFWSLAVEEQFYIFWPIVGDCSESTGLPPEDV